MEDPIMVILTVIGYACMAVLVFGVAILVTGGYGEGGGGKR